MTLWRLTAMIFAAAVAGLLTLPMLVLVFSAFADGVWAGTEHHLFAPALWLSLMTSLVSLSASMIGGIPLAWWLAQSASRRARVVSFLVNLPIVIPPAVIGLALLETFGRGGFLSPVLQAAGVSVPFTPAAVVLAQFVVSAPFFVQAAANAFRKVDPDLLLVARTLGASATGAFMRVAVPVALPGLVGGASLAWARALGEFGATLLFAGNMTGVTQTMPLAIFTALEKDVHVALVLSVVLGAMGAILLLILRVAPVAWSWWANSGDTRVDQADA